MIVGMIGLGVILGLSGPFDTLRVLPLVPRVLYWVFIVASTFAVGSFVDIVLNRVMRPQPIWLRFVVLTVAIGSAVTLVVHLTNLAVFGIWPESWASFSQMFAVITAIAGVVEGGIFALRGARPDEREGGVPLLARLPLDKRGSLIALSAENHYVNVTTTAGSELVLMRLSDAQKEVQGVPGLQIHRSHWVATAHVTKVSKSGDRGEVVLSDGSSRPISRSFMPAVKEAGLLPKSRP